MLIEKPPFLKCLPQWGRIIHACNSLYDDVNVGEPLPVSVRIAFPTDVALAAQPLGHLVRMICWRLTTTRTTNDITTHTPTPWYCLTS